MLPRVQFWFEQPCRPNSIFFRILLLFLSYFYFVYMFCLNVNISPTCVSGACRGQKGTSDPMELELQIFVGYQGSVSEPIANK